MKFLIYNGRKGEIRIDSIGGNSLSRTYIFRLSIPQRIDNDSDYNLLLSYIETVTIGGCCGKKSSTSVSSPMMDGELWGTSRGIPLTSLIERYGN